MFMVIRFSSGMLWLLLVCMLKLVRFFGLFCLVLVKCIYIGILLLSWWNLCIGVLCSVRLMKLVICLVLKLNVVVCLWLMCIFSLLFFLLLLMCMFCSLVCCVSNGIIFWLIFCSMELELFISCICMFWLLLLLLLLFWLLMK